MVEQNQNLQKNYLTNKIKNKLISKIQTRTNKLCPCFLYFLKYKQFFIKKYVYYKYKGNL